MGSLLVTVLNTISNVPVGMIVLVAAMFGLISVNEVATTNEFEMRKQIFCESTSLLPNRMIMDEGLVAGRNTCKCLCFLLRKYYVEEFLAFNTKYLAFWSRHSRYGEY
uniref:Uncharacterized protein n=1 Tax=Glossina pallidipes TaxID=7398 RepID=A0A1A9ZST7_GLOPL